MKPWFVGRLRCPVDRQPLEYDGDSLFCRDHRYRVLSGIIPVLLVPEMAPTHPIAHESLRAASESRGVDLDPVNGVDPFVRDMIAATGGYLYRPLVGRARAYPIPEPPLPRAVDAECLLDIGCGWGRWSIACAQLGYDVIGVDPSLQAVVAATRVARQLGVEPKFLVADARALPFPSRSFQRVFSYSVLQHFAKPDVKQSLREICRVLDSRGTATVQMGNAFGIRSLYHLCRRGFRGGTGFEVRYWTPRELRNAFQAAIGPATLSVDGFFSLNAQRAEAALLPRRYRAVVTASECLKRLARMVPSLAYFADSLYVSGRPRHE